MSFLVSFGFIQRVFLYRCGATGDPAVMTVNFAIPTNGDGIPIFPAIDMETVATIDVRHLLSEFFKAVWSKFLS
jgi:hypothetical protein